MDVLVSKFMHVLAFAAVALLAMAYCGAVAAIMWSFRGYMPKTVLGKCGMICVFLISGPVGLLIMRALRGPMPEKGTKAWPMMAVFLIFCYLLLTFGTMLVLDRLAWRKFNNIMMQKPDRLVISSEGKTNEVNDAAVIGEFFQVVTHSRKVMAHHSHPVAEVKLFFPQSRYIYSLRRDSEYTNEYWFGWEGVSGHEHDWLKADDGLGHLRSDELDRWVKNYAPPEMVPQMQKAR